LKEFHFKVSAFDFFKTQFKRALNLKRIASFESLYDEVVHEFSTEQASLLRSTLESWYESIVELSFLSPLLERYGENLHELIIHSPENIQLFIGRSCHKDSLDISNADLALCLEVMAAKANINWSQAYPFQSFPTFIAGLPYRASLLHDSLCPDGKVKLFLRRPFKAPRLDQLQLEPQAIELLRQAIEQKKNILISGATASGKTTLLRAMLNEVEADEHLVVLEDTPELHDLGGLVTHLVADEDNPQKCLLNYCKMAMRLRPDRIILGELRGAEVTSFLLTLNTGHKGVVTTLHANSARDAIDRVALLFQLHHQGQGISTQALMKTLCKNIDWVIHLENGAVKEIFEVLNSEDSYVYGQELYGHQENRPLRSA
jgi:type IV secretion system protein VirB11